MSASSPHGTHVRPSSLHPVSLTRSEEKSTVHQRDGSPAPSICIIPESRSDAKTPTLHAVVHKITVKLHSARIVGIVSDQSHLRHADS